MSRTPRHQSESVSVVGHGQKDSRDAELFAAVHAGNLAALGLLYDDHQGNVRRFVLRATSNGADADDIVQDVFLTAARVAGTYDDRSGARPFLLGIAANIVRSRRQKGVRWTRAFAALETALTGIFRRTPEDAASASQQMLALNAGLARLSQEKCLVLLMVELEGLSGEEVADALGIPVATVWTRLHYARTELRDHLKRRMR